jgi:hypothetical protein
MEDIFIDISSIVATGCATPPGLTGSLLQPTPKTEKSAIAMVNTQIEVLIIFSLLGSGQIAEITLPGVGYIRRKLGTK